MLEIKPEWRLKLRLFTANILIKIGKLRHADYCAEDLQAIVNTHLPETFPIEVPISKGELTLLKADVSMEQGQNFVNIELLASILIGPPNKPIYRAHLITQLAAYPIFDTQTNTVKVAKMVVGKIKLVNDAYAIIEDSRDLLSLLFPKTLQNLLSGTVKSTLGLLTAGGSDLANNYMKLYLSGSKRRILDYHQPQIEALISDFSKRDALQYQLDSEKFEEQLFCLYGKEVVVESGKLRFKF
jgi:hypothetical protein